MSEYWNYYTNIENDLFQTFRYVEPTRENFSTYSVEYAKIINVSGAEIDNIMKALCKAAYDRNGEVKEAGNMGQYKECLLKYFPHIVDVMLHVPRGGYGIKPFDDWGKTKLFWWDEYQEIKHHRESNWKKASFKNALFTVGALKILNLYIKRFNNNSKYCLANTDGPVFNSEYTQTVHFLSDNKNLPDF